MRRMSIIRSDMPATLHYAAARHQKLDERNPRVVDNLGIRQEANDALA